MKSGDGWNYGEMFEALVAGNLPRGTDLGGRYEIGELLGKGGVGLVYRALDVMLGEDVVLKILNPALASDPDTVKRFKREIKICRKIGHPNVIRIYDIDEIYGTMFISMELVSGMNLKSLIRHRNRIGEAEGRDILAGMVRGLSAAHGMGIVHRDLKSQNVMVDDQGQVKLLDFGMARFLGMDHLTRGGDILGSPPYMSPEQAQALEVDHRTDIYSLGIILFEMFTGTLPFLGETPLATVLMQIDREPPRPSSLNPAISPDLEQAILTCLRKRPEDRFQSVEELLGRREERRSRQSWHIPSDATDHAMARSFGACLAGAVASVPVGPLPPELHAMLELAATVTEAGNVDGFAQGTADARARLAWLSALALVPGLRHFTNRTKMRQELRELLNGQDRETVALAVLVGEVLSLLARQRSRADFGTLTLRSLLGLLRERLPKAFASEPRLAEGLEVLQDPLPMPLDASQFEKVYSSRAEILALHVLFTDSVPAPAGLEEMLAVLGASDSPSEIWRQAASSLTGALWAFWHGVEAISHHRLQQRPAVSLALELGSRLVPPPAT